MKQVKLQHSACDAEMTVIKGKTTKVSHTATVFPRVVAQTETA